MLLWVVFLGWFLSCAGISVVFMVYVCLLWYASLRLPPTTSSEGKEGTKGLSAAELERLPGVGDGELIKGMECAVCLEDIEAGQPARVLPECRHAFHRPCADTWLFSNAACPLCRTPPIPPPPPSSPVS